MSTIQLQMLVSSLLVIFLEITIPQYFTSDSTLIEVILESEHVGIGNNSHLLIFRHSPEARESNAIVL